MENYQINHQNSNNMAPESIGIMYVLKTYFLATFVAFFGGLAHAIEVVKRQGWRGWISFMADVFVCIFFGNVFYQMGLIFAPKMAVVLTSLGSFWGAKSFDYLKVWIIKSIQSNLPK